VCSCFFVQGSIRLKSYAGRSIFNDLLSAPATRKRAGVQDIIDSFPESRFFLIGDSGQQDLELYAESVSCFISPSPPSLAPPLYPIPLFSRYHVPHSLLPPSLAAKYPSRILAVLIRDVEPDAEPIEDPTGSCFLQLSASPLSSLPGSMARSLSALSGRVKAAGRRQSKGEDPGLNGEYFTAAPWYATEMRMTEEPEEMGDGRRGGVEVNSRGGRSGSGNPRTLPSSRVRFSVNGNGAGARATASPRSDSYQSTSPLSSPSLPLRSSLNVNRTTTTTATTSSSGSNTTSRGVLSDLEKRRVVLQRRVHKARARMPSETVLRVFRGPKECVEVEEVFAREEGHLGEDEGRVGRREEEG